MITNLREITSLNNLGRKGQVATLLILMMVAVLVFILATVNIGQTSLTATNLANAADSGALYLGSQLATKSNVLYESLDNTTSKCQKGGWASLVFAIVLAVVAIVVTWGAATPFVVAAGAAGGAVGGAAGAAYQGTSVGAGTIQGAMIGAAIGAGATAGAAQGGTFAAGTEAGIIEAASLMASGAPGTTSAFAVGSTVGALAGGTLTAGSNVYNFYVAERMTAAAFDAAAKALNGLPEYDRYREGVFLQALTQTIDDPNEIQDHFDSDEDGDTEEMVPYFQYWWDMRMGKYKEITPQLQSLTQGFLDYTDDFVNEITVDKCLSYGLESNSCVAYDYGYLSSLSKTISEVGSALDCTFSDSGSLDVVRDDLDDFTQVANELLIEKQNQGIEMVTSSWQTWLNFFYNPEAGSGCANCGDDEEGMDFYRMFDLMINGDPSDPDFVGLEEWKVQIEEARQNLPDCQRDNMGDSEGGYSNWPCKTSGGGSIDYDLDDEIGLALDEIDTMISGLTSFQDSILAYYTDMDTIYVDALDDWGGENPVTYTWTDSRGDHEIEVEAGPYKLAWIETRKSGGFLKKEICLVLEDYSDDGGRAWIKVTRRDPANKELGILGKWNPNASADEGFFTITRRSGAAYSYNYIQMSGK